MNILVLQETDWILRGPHQQHHIMERLSIRGNKIHVIDFEFLWKNEKEFHILTSKRIFKTKPKISLSSNIQIIRPAMIKLPILSYCSIIISHFFAIMAEIKHFRPHIIIGFSIINSFLGLILAKLMRIPFCYYLIDHLHTLLPEKYLQTIAKRIESLNVQFCDYLFVINKGLLDYAQALIKNHKEGIIIPGGVDLNIYQNANIGNELREKLSISKNDIVLMFMGWLYEFSGLKELSEYIFSNENYLPGIKLLVVGKGDLFDYLEIIKTKLKDSTKIILTNQVPFKDIPNYLSIANFCLLPAQKNKIMDNIVPIKLYEYIAAGKIVFATKLKGIYKEFGKDNGIVYINDVSDIFEKLKLPKEFFDRISENSKNFIKNYDWGLILARFDNILHEICQKKNKEFYT